MRKAPAKQKSSSLLGSLGTVLITFLLIGAFVVFLLPVVLERVMEVQLSKATGLSVQIGKVHFSLTRPQFVVGETQFLNPPDFPGAPLVQIGQIRIHYAPSPTFLGWMILQKVEIDFREFRLVRNKRGVLNLPQTGPTAKGRNTIGEVVLNLRSVTYTDLSGAQAAQERFDLKLVNAVYRNVKGVAGIFEILNWEILKRTGVEEKAKPALPEIKPIAESQTTGQIAPEPAASVLPESGSPQPEPALAPSTEETGSPS